jgi:hypothetical protein
VIAGAVTDAYSIVVSNQPLRRSVQVVAGWAGATGGCKVLGASGAYLAARETSGLLFDWTKGSLFNKLHGENPPPQPKGSGFRAAGECLAVRARAGTGERRHP